MRCTDPRYKTHQFTSNEPPPSPLISITTNVINYLVSSDPPSLVWLLSGIYGPPVQSDRKNLWDNFECLSGNFAGPHVIIGDLNSTLEDWETWSRSGHSGSGCLSRAMRELVLRSGFVDLGAQGPTHTWFGRHHRGAIIHARLDMALSNVMWKEVFLSLDENPIAAASIAQVHPAISKDCQEVAIKVQYPGLEQKLKVDTITMSFLSKSIAWILTFNLAFLIISVLLFWDIILVDDVVYMKNRGIDTIKVAKVLAEVFVEMIFVHGFVHGDPHPGNILVCPEGHNRFLLVLLDHGIYKKLDEGFRLKYCQLQIQHLTDQFGISMYSRYLPVIFTGRTIDSGLLRSTMSKLGASQWVRLLAYAKFALHGLSSQSDSKSVLNNVKNNVKDGDFKTVLHRSNGMRLYVKVSKGHVNVVFSWSSSAMTI
ncbi:hypothetical protein UlMin_003647 [Ulmus minor]